MREKLFKLLILIAVLVVSFGCAQLPKDKLTLYNRGIQEYNQRNYEEALEILLQFTKIDSVYSPLFDVIAHCYYEIDDFENAMIFLRKSFSLSEQAHNNNLYFSMLSETIGDKVVEDKVSFLQYVRHVSENYGIDPGLLLAIMNQESDFIADAVSVAGAAGLMQLMPQTARILGLQVPDENVQKKPQTVDPQIDERFDPAKNIRAGANHFNFLLNHYRIDNKTTNLNMALAGYLAGTLNVVDEIPQYAEHYVKRIQNFYQDYRKNFVRQTEASRLFYSRNDISENPFLIKYFPDNTRMDYRYINQYYQSLTDKEVDKLGYDKVLVYNNLAIIAGFLDDSATAEDFYLKALSIDPFNNKLLINLVFFYFDNLNYDDALTYIGKYNEHFELNPEFGVIESNIYLLRNDLSRAREVLWDYHRKFPDNAKILNNYGLLFFMEENYHMADFYFQQALDFSEDPIFANNYLCKIYQNYYGDYSSAYFTRLNKSSFLKESDYVWPLPNRDINSGFGWRPSPFLNVWSERLANMDFHNGIDIPAPMYTPVLAVASGIVTVSTAFSLGGETIFVKHEDGNTALYLHLQERLVEEGDLVEQGQVIGLVGTTGMSTGPHLHLGFFNNQWKPVNPLKLLPSY